MSQSGNQSGNRANIPEARAALDNMKFEIARELGIRTFLLTDYIINKKNQDINQYPHGSFPELMNFIREL